MYNFKITLIYNFYINFYILIKRYQITYIKDNYNRQVEVSF